MTAVAEEKNYTWDRYLLDPAPNVNYDVILCLQLGGVFVGVVLAVLWATLGVAEGYWLVFFPFVPSAVWAYAVRARWQRQRRPGGAAKPSKQKAKRA